MMQRLLYEFMENIPVFENLILSALFGAGIFIVFYVTNRKLTVSNSFAYTLILLPLISCMIALIVSYDFVFIVGMLGALSIIRFRHSMKESKNLVFIFWAVTAGIACGLSFRGRVFLWFIIVAITVLIIHYISKIKRTVTLTVKMKSDTGEVEEVLNELSIPFKVKLKSIDETSVILYELYYKKGMDKSMSKSLCDKIMLSEGVLSARFIEM